VRSHETIEHTKGGESELTPIHRDQKGVAVKAAPFWRFRGLVPADSKAMESAPSAGRLARIMSRHPANEISDKT
jgi:hypothetical protein